MKNLYHILLFLLMLSIVGCKPKQKKQFTNNNHNKEIKKETFNSISTKSTSKKLEINSNSNANLLVSSVQKKVDNFDSAIDTFKNYNPKKGISADEVAKLIANANNKDALRFCVQTTFSRKCLEIDKLIPIYEQFLKRNLSEIQKGTMLQVICLAEIQRRNFEGAIKRVDDELKENNNYDKSLMFGLLGMKEMALNGLNRKDELIAVLEEEIKIAKLIGKPEDFIKLFEGKLARIKGEPWEQLDPRRAEREKKSKKMRAINNQYAVQKFNQMPYEKKEELLNQIKDEIDKTDKNELMSNKEKKKLLNELTEMLNLLTTNNKEAK